MGAPKLQEAYLQFEGVNLLFDVVEKESLVHTAAVTDHPVEEGPDVSDNIRAQNAQVTLEAFVSNAPIRDVNNLWSGGTVAGLPLKVPTVSNPQGYSPGALIYAGVAAAKEAINGPPPPPKQWGATVLSLDEKNNAVGFVFGQLLDWQTRGVIGKCITAHRTYDSVAITRVEMNRDGTTGDGAPFSIDLREIRVVQTAQITAPIPTEPRGQTMVAKGRQPTSFVRDPGRRKSELKKFTKG